MLSTCYYNKKHIYQLCLFVWFTFLSTIGTTTIIMMRRCAGMAQIAEATRPTHITAPAARGIQLRRHSCIHKRGDFFRITAASLH